MPQEHWIELELARIVIQQKGDQQYLHLREKDGERSFPIVIGFNEVEEINRKLRGIAAPRPLTHDLIGLVLQTLEHQLVEVVISELRDSTFYANLILHHYDTGEEKTVDCRPSTQPPMNQAAKSPQWSECRWPMKALLASS